MTIGRLSVGWVRDHKGRIVWDWPEWVKAICGCHIVSAGPFAATWHDRECRCQACGGYVCGCEERERKDG